MPLDISPGALSGGVPVAAPGAGGAAEAARGLPALFGLLLAQMAAAGVKPSEPKSAESKSADGLSAEPNAPEPTETPAPDLSASVLFLPPILPAPVLLAPTAPNLNGNDLLKTSRSVEAMDTVPTFTAPASGTPRLPGSELLPDLETNKSLSVTPPAAPSAPVVVMSAPAVRTSAGFASVARADVVPPPDAALASGVSAAPVALSPALHKSAAPADNGPEAPTAGQQKSGEIVAQNPLEKMAATIGRPQAGETPRGPEEEKKQAATGGETFTLAAPTARPAVETVPAAAPMPQTDRARLIEQAADAVRTIYLRSAGRGEGQITVSMHPKDWGRLQLSVATTSGTDAGSLPLVAAQIVAETPTVKAALEGHVGELRRALDAMGLRLDSLSVTVQPPAASGESSAPSSGGSGQTPFAGADGSAANAGGGQSSFAQSQENGRPRVPFAESSLPGASLADPPPVARPSASRLNLLA